MRQGKRYIKNLKRQKKNVAFVANDDKVDDKKSSANDEKIEELTLILKRLEGIAKNSKWTQKLTTNNKVVGFKCKEEEHIKRECPKASS